MGFSMLISAFVVAFSQQWKLTLVTATTLPAGKWSCYVYCGNADGCFLVVFLVGLTVMFDQKLEAKILDIYSKAGGLAEEALGSVRNVVAFGAHEKLQAKYKAYLDSATNFGMKKGPLLGLQYSSEFSIMYCAYGLSFWYGIQLFLKGEITSGGTVFTYSFCSPSLSTPLLTCIQSLFLLHHRHIQSNNHCTLHRRLYQSLSCSQRRPRNDCTRTPHRLR
jgi:ATP-binding cassette subfamily B (MDR/TAP) protein 1